MHQRSFGDIFDVYAIACLEDAVEAEHIGRVRVSCRRDQGLGFTVSPEEAKAHPQDTASFDNHCPRSSS